MMTFHLQMVLPHILLQTVLLLQFLIKIHVFLALCAGYRTHHYLVLKFLSSAHYKIALPFPRNIYILLGYFGILMAVLLVCHGVLWCYSKLLLSSLCLVVGLFGVVLVVIGPPLAVVYYLGQTYTYV